MQAQTLQSSAPYPHAAQMHAHPAAEPPASSGGGSLASAPVLYTEVPRYCPFWLLACFARDLRSRHPCHRGRDGVGAARRCCWSFCPRSPTSFLPTPFPPHDCVRRQFRLLPLVMYSAFALLPFHSSLASSARRLVNGDRARSSGTVMPRWRRRRSSGALSILLRRHPRTCKPRLCPQTRRSDWSWMRLQGSITTKARGSTTTRHTSSFLTPPAATLSGIPRPKAAVLLTWLPRKLLYPPR